MFSCKQLEEGFGNKPLLSHQQLRKLINYNGNTNWEHSDNNMHMTADQVCQKLVDDKLKLECKCEIQIYLFYNIKASQRIVIRGQLKNNSTKRWHIIPFEI